MVLIRCKYCGSVNIDKDWNCLNCKHINLHLWEINFVYMITVEDLDVGIIGEANEIDVHSS